MTDSSSSGRQSPPQRSVRVSVACAPCRAHHLRCDAVLPSCSRCQTEAKHCIYPKSRRGRPRRSGVLHSSTKSTIPVSIIEAVPSVSTVSCNLDSRRPEVDQNQSNSVRGISMFDDALERFVSKQLLSHYYSFFHAAHPFVLPQRVMKHYILSDSMAVRPLYSVMQYIGSLFAPSIPSEPLKSKAEHELVAVRVRDLNITGYDVQAALLFSIAVYWCDEMEKAEEFLDEAIRMALKLGMNSSEFAVKNGRQDPILEECWRRTWWQIYITDAHVAGSSYRYPYRTSRVEMDVPLPCEESDYEIGKIPQPRTLQEYEMREFMDDGAQEFSSFAEFVGLTRALDVALAPCCNFELDTIADVSMNVDAAVTAWSSLLPTSKKSFQRRDGSFDELLFNANALILAYTIGLHRRFSTLSYYAVEAIAKCPPPGPPEVPSGYSALECQLHTSKVLLAIERFNTLLTLPTDITTHTPFLICKLTNTIKTHLVACHFIYKGHQLRLARERIRLSMGSLKALGEYWPLGKRSYQELGIIAREILSLKSQSQHHTVLQEPLVQSVVPEELPALTLPIPDNSFDFCDYFDLNLHDTISSLP
ncbi:putative C6 transcription factor [Xylogone sp. PMI_703]|nr:putative C6 transcription factor [Xylogone sp. PMI_703]